MPPLPVITEEFQNDPYVLFISENIAISIFMDFKMEKIPIVLKQFLYTTFSLNKFSCFANEMDTIL